MRELLAFDPSTAGGMMNTEFVFVSEDSTREEVLQWMRTQELNLEQLDTIVLIDKAAQFSGRCRWRGCCSRRRSSAWGS